MLCFLLNALLPFVCTCLPVEGAATHISIHPGIKTPPLTSQYPPIAEQSTHIAFLWAEEEVETGSVGDYFFLSSFSGGEQRKKDPASNFGNLFPPFLSPPFLRSLPIPSPPPLRKATYDSLLFSFSGLLSEQGILDPMGVVWWKCPAASNRRRHRKMPKTGECQI